MSRTLAGEVRALAFSFALALGGALVGVRRYVLGASGAGAIGLDMSESFAIVARAPARRLGPLRRRTQPHRVANTCAVVAIERLLVLALALALAFAQRVEVLALAQADRGPWFVP